MWNEKQLNSLNKILALNESGNQSKYFYRGHVQDGQVCHCAIGILMTEEELDAVDSQCQNSSGIFYALNGSLIYALHERTGLSIEQLDKIQQKNDKLETMTEFRNFIIYAIENGKL